MSRRTLWQVLAFTALAVGFACSVGYAIREHRASEELRKRAARAEVWVLSGCVESHKVNTGSYPPSLEALVQSRRDGALPVLEKPDLIDSWGRPYQYDEASRGPGRLLA